MSNPPTDTTQPPSDSQLSHLAQSLTNVSLASEPQTPSPLLALPTELQDMIYAYLLPTNSTVLLRVERAPDDRHSRVRPASPDLLHVCHQIRAEVPLHDYYAKNTFLFFDGLMSVPVLRAFVASRGEAVRAMRRIRVTLTHRWPGTAAFTGDGIYVRFSMSRAHNGVVTLDAFDAEPRGYNFDDGEFCCCALQRLAARGSLLGSGGLVGLLLTFMEGCAAEERPKYFTARRCASCGKTHFTPPERLV
ncbi:hypothetical protein LTR53_010069 [Teratosphaeriaceae sp. CCFEE 6253]|nr:hypothetical protein LTR53_010069 [Teratosphaeriaceae sp. CCFEE 6253]